MEIEEIKNKLEKQNAVLAKMIQGNRSIIKSLDLHKSKMEQRVKDRENLQELVKSRIDPNKKGENHGA
jgi:hypothetical protein